MHTIFFLKLPAVFVHCTIEILTLALRVYGNIPTISITIPIQNTTNLLLEYLDISIQVLKKKFQFRIKLKQISSILNLGIIIFIQYRNNRVK